MCGVEEIGLGLMGIGLADSLFGEDKAGDAYDAELTRSTAYYQRKYAADVENYETALRTFKKNKNYLQSLIADPTGHPDYKAAKSTLEKQFKGSRESLKQALRKRGRTGGVQDRVSEDLQRTFEESLTGIHEQIGGKAREQLLTLSEPPKPYMGMPNVDWNKYFTPSQADPIADLTGFGMLLALNQSVKSTTTDSPEISTLARSGQSTDLLGSLPHEVQDWMTEF